MLSGWKSPLCSPTSSWQGWSGGGCRRQASTVFSAPPFLGKPERAQVVQRYSSPVIPLLDPIRVSQQKHMHSWHRLDYCNSSSQCLQLSPCGTRCFGRRDQPVASILEHSPPCTPAACPAVLLWLAVGTGGFPGLRPAFAQRSWLPDSHQGVSGQQENRLCCPEPR